MFCVAGNALTVYLPPSLDCNTVPHHFEVTILAVSRASMLTIQASLLLKFCTLQLYFIFYELLSQLLYFSNVEFSSIFKSPFFQCVSSIMMNFPYVFTFLHWLLSFSLLSCCEIFLHSSAFNSFGWLACNNCKLQVVLLEDILPTDEVETSSTWEALLSLRCSIK